MRCKTQPLKLCVRLHAIVVSVLLCGGCQSIVPIPHAPPSAVSVAVPESDSPEERVRMLAASRLVEQDQQELVDAVEKPRWKAALRSVNRSATPAMR